MFWVGGIVEGFTEGVALELGLTMWGGKEMEGRFIHSMAAQRHEQNVGGWWEMWLHLERRGEEEEAGRIGRTLMRPCLAASALLDHEVLRHRASFSSSLKVHKPSTPNRASYTWAVQ